MSLPPEIGSGLTAKQTRFVEAVVSGEAHSAADAARIAGYSVPNAHMASIQGSATANKPRVKAALEAIYAQDGGAEAWAHSKLRRFADDADESWKRAPAVRSVELVMRATGQLGPDTQVNIDARTALLPGVATLDGAGFEQLVASLLTSPVIDVVPESEAT